MRARVHTRLVTRAGDLTIKRTCVHPFADSMTHDAFVKLASTLSKDSALDDGALAPELQQKRGAHPIAAMALSSLAFAIKACRACCGNGVNIASGPTVMNSESRSRPNTLDAQNLFITRVSMS